MIPGGTQLGSPMGVAATGVVEMAGQLVETSVEVDPAAELSGVYRYVGAGEPSCAPPPEKPRHADLHRPQ